MIKFVNICKILNFLLYYQFLNLKLVLNYNITNFLELLLNNNKENINLERLKYKKIRLIDINNNKKDIKLVNINK